MPSRTGWLAALLALGLLPCALSAQVAADSVAFPGAVGWGATALTTCDRSNVQVLRVTSTAGDSTSGTLRWALGQVDSTRLSVVVFTRGGDIVLSNPVYIDHPCTYIAVQTAPGGGVQFRGLDNGSAGNSLFLANRDRRGHDVVFRFGRARLGRNGNRDAPATADGALGRVIDLSSGSRYILDHISTAWGNAETISFNPVLGTSGGKAVDSVTVSNSYIGAALWPHPTCILAAGPDPWLSYITIVRNVISECEYRMPLLHNQRNAQVINNVIANWSGRVSNFSAEASQQWRVDVIGNTYRPGPASNPNRIIQAIVDESEGRDGDGRIYAAGNVHTTLHPDPAGDQTWLVAYGRDASGPVPDSFWVDTAQNAPPAPVPVLSAAVAEALAYDSAGASVRLDCDGTWVWARDATDSTLISNARNGTGNTFAEANRDSPADWGGMKTHDAGTTCTDADTDGLPDAWETAHGGTALGVSEDADGDGWSRVEEYVNGTDPAVYTNRFGQEGTPLPPPDPDNPSRRYYWLALRYATGPVSDTLSRYIPERVSPGIGYDTWCSNDNCFDADSVLVATYADLGADTVESAAALPALCARTGIDCDDVTSKVLPGQPEALLWLAPYARPERRVLG